ncbi:MAG: 3-oxoacyl-ACP reductase FabG [Puniceicoccales bacterium]|jgi:3-oxoacyl-[acyl-carrier protein] reductase|nr:3-oxoacyl-ACP reductase FabG [Puniceicoccales bacterium]
MDLNLKNKVVLVTGGSRGIGEAICEGFSAEGARVAFNYASSHERAAKIAARLRERGAWAGAFAADMGKPDEVAALIDAVEREAGRIDILVNNAAVCPKGPVTSYSIEEWERTFAVNVSGAFLATRAVVARLLAEEKTGTIVNIVSQAAFRGSTTGHLPYDSSKGALVSLTVGLAREISAKGIRVNAVAPGLVRTEMVAKTWEERKEHYLRNIPIGRIAEPEEIANAVLFLASDRASYITGATLDISGGMIMR